MVVKERKEKKRKEPVQVMMTELCKWRFFVLTLPSITLIRLAKGKKVTQYQGCDGKSQAESF